MNRALQFTLRIIVVCAVLAGIGPITAPARMSNEAPYLSALSDLATSAFAAPSACERQACTSRGLCAHSPDRTNCRHAAGECQTTAC